MIAAIIQARMGSTRLPGKVLKEVSGQALLCHVIRRVRLAQALDYVVVATSDKPADDAVVAACTGAEVPCFRGSEGDVLDRYYGAARWCGAETIIRITADCPLIDPEVLDRLVDVYRAAGCDYVSNTIERTYPRGLDAEVFSRRALEIAWREAALQSEREHVTPYIWKNPTRFKLCHVTQDRDLSHLRWTVDEPEDLVFVRRVYEHLHSRGEFLMDDVLALLTEHPELGAINRGFGTNEGYRQAVERNGRVEIDGSSGQER